MTIEATAVEPEEVVTPAEEEVEPKAEETPTTPEETPEAEEAVQIPSSQLQAFIDQQAALQSQLQAAQQEAEQLRLQQQQDTQAQTAADTAAAESQALAAHIQEKEAAYSEALLAGDKDGAAQLYSDLATARQMQIDRTVEAQVAKSQSAMTATMQAQLAGERLNAKVAEYTVTYAQLDSTSDKYDDALTTDINELTAAFKASGMPADAALTKAVTTYQHKLTPSTSASTPVSAAKAGTRKGLKEKLADASRQPGTPAGKASGEAQLPTEVINIAELSDDEFANLKPDVLKAMRGDSMS
jgi:chromosome segregation ATPase